MRFGKTLRQSIYQPWQDKYIDYGKLKSLLREDRADDDNVPWTPEDESRFSDEIFNVELEKVAQFQGDEVQKLHGRVDAAVNRLKALVTPSDHDGAAAPKSESLPQRLKDLEAELDEITNEVKQLKKYSSVNYTGFLKIAKKHDRKRGDGYKIRPIMQMSLSKRPFNSEEGYSALLNKLSLLYFAIRQHLEGDGTGEPIPINLGSQPEMHKGERYTALKFWVHPDDLLEVKTFILRRLPALVYSQQEAKELDSKDDPTITSLYFDNSKFDLYLKKVSCDGDGASLRLRWFGQVSARPEILLEQKLVRKDGDSEERKIPIKDKYVKPFLDGHYKMEKSMDKMERQGQSAKDIEDFKSTVVEIQEFARGLQLEPVLRANYVRTAFQNPGDTRVRVSIDTNIAFIREDALDRDRPCRDPSEWHRADIDRHNMTYPFKNINQGEISRFPYAVLEIKLKEDAHRKRPAWIEDLAGSHLVHAAPKFSKFVHGVASLLEDHVNQLPFWLSDLEIDIRKDPQAAFEEEEQRRARRAEDEQVVGSVLCGRISNSYKPNKSSPIANSYLSGRLLEENQIKAKATARSLPPRVGAGNEPPEPLGNDAEPQSSRTAEQRNYGTLTSMFPAFFSKYAKSRQAREEAAALPPGILEPKQWIKNMEPLKIEPKVWLANERTFLKWQHISILLGGLAVSLYTAAGENRLAEAMGVSYVLIATFAGCWGFWMLQKRRKMIVQRSGRDFDNRTGPLLTSFAMMVALILNLMFAYKDAFRELRGHEGAAGSFVGEASGLLDEL